MVSLKNHVLIVQKRSELCLYICIQETLSRIRERVREARVRVYRIRPFLSFYMKDLMLEFKTFSKAGF